LKTVDEIRSVKDRLFLDPLEVEVDLCVKGALEWVLGGSYSTLDEVLPERVGEKKSEEDIREARRRLFEKRPWRIDYVFVDRTLKWVLELDDDFLDYLLVQG